MKNQFFRRQLTFHNYLMIRAEYYNFLNTMQEKTVHSCLFKKIDCFFIRSGGLIAMTVMADCKYYGGSDRETLNGYSNIQQTHSSNLEIFFQ